MHLSIKEPLTYLPPTSLAIILVIILQLNSNCIYLFHTGLWEQVA